MYMKADGDTRVLFAPLLMPAVYRWTYNDLPDFRCCVTVSVRPSVNLNQSSISQEIQVGHTVKDNKLFSVS